MKAKLILHTKEVKGDEIIEIKIWKVQKSKSYPDGVKFSLVYIEKRKRIIGYDNGEGKGYHRHYLDKEEPYDFKNIQKLLNDFKIEVLRLRGRDWDED